MRHIHVIAPVANPNLGGNLGSILAKAARSDTLVSSSVIESGPESIESIYEDAIAVPGVVKRALEAEKAGADAILIDCMNDPGLEEAREAVGIPVVGTAQAAMLTAGMLAHRFTMIGTDRRDAYPVERLVTRYGLEASYASTRWASIPVLELHANRERLVADLVEQSMRAVEQDGAHAILFGCTVMRGLDGEVRSRLAERGIHVPILDPSYIALKWAESLIDLRLTQSQRTYPSAKAKLVWDADGSNLQPLKRIPGGQKQRNHTLSVIVPVVRGERDVDWLNTSIEGYTGYVSAGNCVDVRAIEYGPSEILSPYDQAMAAVDILRLARRAEKNGSNAVIIDCMCDPGLQPAREALDIPVIGPMQASAYTAKMLANRFAIIGTSMDYLHVYPEKIRGYGLGDSLASVRGVGLSPIEVESDPSLTERKIIEGARLAVLEDGAHAIIPGCTGMIGLAGAVRNALLGEGIDVPVIEPAAVALRVAEMLCELGLSHSKQTWPRPPHKCLPGYADLEF